MKSIISAANNYIDNKKAERVAENTAWQKVRGDIDKADAMYDEATQAVADSWGKLEESCHVKDPVEAEAMANESLDDMLKATDAEYDAGEALREAKAVALALAKGNHNVMLHKTKYMVKPEPTRMAPYM